MATPNFSQENVEYFKSRIERLTPDAKANFGVMDSLRTMHHLRTAIEAALGEIELPDESKPIIRSILYVLICHVITKWPGGKVKAPEYWSPPADQEFDEEKAALLATMDRFVEVAKAEPGRTGAHPMMGPLTMRKWERLMGLHFQHHFRQFSVE